MRPIMPGEVCFSATEIAEKYAAEKGEELHPTNIGNAAKKLDLDYVEDEPIESPGGYPMKPQKRYSELDFPSIFKFLDELVARRAR